MAYISIFKMDDTEVSGAGVYTNSVDRDAPIGGASDALELYVQADNGYNVTSTTITPTGATATQWAIAPDAGGTPGVWGAYGAAYNAGTVGDDPGEEVYFWVRARATGGETPSVDQTVTLVVAGTAATE